MGVHRFGAANFVLEHVSTSLRKVEEIAAVAWEETVE
jgi:hypothetical protein